MSLDSLDARPVALVLGAGAQGLACALRLWERGWDVTVAARDWLSDTTSSGAGAIWEYPPFQVQPQQQAKQWVLESLPTFAAAMEAAGSRVSGIRLRRSYYLFRSKQSADKLYGPLDAWSSRVPHFREGLPPPGLSCKGTFAYGFSYVAPVINMRRYLSWLTEVIGELPGVQFQHAVLADVADVTALAKKVQADVSINCLGLGTRSVFGDESLYGVRGDLLYVLAPGTEAHYDFAQVSDEDDPAGSLTYAVPQGDGVIALAGTAEKLTAEELVGGYQPHLDPVAVGEIDRGILTRALAAIPGALLVRGNASDSTSEPIVVSRWSGARPQREGGVRLVSEKLPVPGDEGSVFAVVHNYGHGGSGVVTSWGCAAEVVKLACDLCLPLHGSVQTWKRASSLQPRTLPTELEPLAVGCVHACGEAVLARDAHLYHPPVQNALAKL